MAVRKSKSCVWIWRISLFIGAVLCAHSTVAQLKPEYSIKNGRMHIHLPKNLKPAALDSFISQFDLADLQLHALLKTNSQDSLKKQGWRIEGNNNTRIVISRPFQPFKDISAPGDVMNLGKTPDTRFPSVNNGVAYGVNAFKNKNSFTTSEGLTHFFLRGYLNAQKVMLTGSFNNWAAGSLPMQKTADGWTADVKLSPGKYWYKFIVDDTWMTDADNRLSENDSEGNTNSVFYQANTIFVLPGYSDAKKVFLAGSFNNWKERELLMTRSTNGWALSLYLPDGTHTYKFIVDKKWVIEENKKERLPDGHGAFNSVLRIGESYPFLLNGFMNAKEVFVAGTFNSWKENELLMQKTATGWQLPYTLGPGNYEYKFKVDGKWISDPSTTVRKGDNGNSFLVFKPNYTFRYSGSANAKRVYLAGDFNNWDPLAYPMKKEGDAWIFPVHLSAGKHLYKFIVDDVWIIDPGNKLWEQNEFGNGNSVIWVDR